jgi:iron complex transport system ATP-binding protein
LTKLLTIQNLSTGYRLKKGKTKVLHKNLSAEVYEGEFIAILGPNGAGKSTLLKTLSGFIPALNGEIKYGNDLLENIPVKELATKVSVVLTDKIDDIYLTVEDVISAARYPYGSFWKKPSEKDKKIISEAMELTGTKKFTKRKLHTLSDGERQRVMIARALAQDTPLVFLDEPTAFIDSPGRVELMHLLKTIPKKGKSFLMTIHDVELALHFADTLWLLGNNERFEKGNPKELIGKGSINRLFDRGTVKFNPKNNSFL